MRISDWSSDVCSSDLHDTKEAIGRLAWNVGRRISGGLFDREAGWAVVEEALDDIAGADRRDVEKSFDAGLAKDFDVAGMLLDMRCAEFQRTDMGNAERWFARFGRDYLYTTDKGWLGWDGRQIGRASCRERVGQYG